MAMRRIAVVGNCQAHGLACCIGAMSPDIEASNHWVHAFYPGGASFDDFATGYDDIILMDGSEHRLLPNAATTAKLTPFPNFHFDAFHPDAVVAQHDGAYIFNPMGEVHSSIALHAWKSGMTAEQALSLFNEQVFDRLGFFSRWESSYRDLCNRNQSTLTCIQRNFKTWERSGCFVYIPAHPRLNVLGDIARWVADQIGLQTKTRFPERFVYDSLSTSSIWPIYPEIATRLGLEGDYGFKTPNMGVDEDVRGRVLSLDEYVSLNFKIYDSLDASRIECEALDNPAFQDLDHFHSTSRLGVPTPEEDGEAAGRVAASSHADGNPGNPYKRLPDYCFWPRAVASVAMADVDPVVPSTLSIGPTDRIATAGSCFAQHISTALQARGFNYLVTESAPEGVDADTAHRRNFGTFSARYGNLYTARQLLQLFDRAYGHYRPGAMAWERKAAAGLADPFRPLIEPDGFASVDALVEARRVHFAAVRHMFETLDCFVFTLGLTEAWYDLADGAVFPLAPGVVAGEFDPSRFGFANFRVADIVADMTGFIERLRNVNPRSKLVLTVSPVPLMATAENRHVLTSTTYSKSVLRVAADELCQQHRDVFYFPSYEIIIGNYARSAYFEPDLRSVNQEGVDHVMRLFMKHFTMEAAAPVAEPAKAADLICDENFVVF